jgi:hypothetical protein
MKIRLDRKGVTTESELERPDETGAEPRPEREKTPGGALPTTPRRAPVTWRLPPRGTFPAPRFDVIAESELDPVHVVESLGLRSDTPRALVKAIVTAVQSVNSKDANGVEKALSAFDLTTLLRPNASVASLACGIADLSRSSTWPRLVKRCG